jgi:spore germination protein YaaH
MAAKKPGRYLAPVALIAVAVAVVLIVRGRVDSHHHPRASPRVHQLPVSRHVPPKRTFYVIKAGDSLSSISVKTGVPITRLEALNPSVDPNSLQTGQRIRLRR